MTAIPRTALTFPVLLAGALLAGCSVPQATAPDPQQPPTTAAVEQEPTQPAKPKSRADADAFKAYVKDNGTPQEKQAAEHVVKLRISGNDALGVATITTDLEGDLTSGSADTGKLIASAFADWKQSDNGSSLVTINSGSGELLANGNY